MNKLPDDILRQIYEYDDTYIVKYHECINEMNYCFSYNHVIDNMNIINFYYNQYKIYCEMNNNIFYFDIYGPIMPLSRYYRKFIKIHHMKYLLKNKNIKKMLTISKKINRI